MSTLTYFLQQQTPLIHFQHLQAGAGIRATEVKPALDAYLTKQAKQGIPDEWKVGFGHNKIDALNYQLRFSGGNYKSEQIEDMPSGRGRPKQFPLFFANMGNSSSKNEHKYFVFSEELIRLEINTFVPALKELLEQHLGAFFASHNFMSRKTKGFGSFLLVGKNNVPILPQAKYSFQVNGGKGSGKAYFRPVFEQIEALYRSLRSGINSKKDRGETDVFYFKSLLFQYAKQKGEQWDKRKMRRDLFSEHPDFRKMERQRTDKNGPVHYNDGEARLYRDMLGLASDTMWLKYDKASVKKENKKIDRYPSPITFKPVMLANGKFLIYILTRQAEPAMLDASFGIKSSYRHKSTTMKTPKKFDINDYLDFAFHYFGSGDIAEKFDFYVEGHDQNSDDLYNIYSQLSQQ